MPKKKVDNQRLTMLAVDSDRLAKIVLKEKIFILSYEKKIYVFHFSGTLATKVRCYC